MRGWAEPRSRALRSTGWAANRAPAPRTSQGTTSSKVAEEVVRRRRAPAVPPARATGVRRRRRWDWSPISRRKPAAEAT